MTSSLIVMMSLIQDQNFENICMFTHMLILRTLPLNTTDLRVRKGEG